MTAHRDPWIGCDFAGPCMGQWPEDAGEAVYVDSTIAKVRKDARAHGWKCDAHGDYCPDHRWQHE